MLWCAVWGASSLDEAFTNGEERQLGAIVDVHLLHDGGAVGVDGLGAAREGLGDLSAGEALADQSQNLLLTRSEVLDLGGGLILFADAAALLDAAAFHDLGAED